MGLSEIDVHLLSNPSAQTLAATMTPLGKTTNDGMVAVFDQHPGCDPAIASLPTVGPFASERPLERSVDLGPVTAVIFSRTLGKFLDAELFEPIRGG